MLWFLTSLQGRSITIGTTAALEHFAPSSTWGGRSDQNPNIRGYLFAVLAVLFAFIWRLSIDRWLGNQMPYTTFIVAVAAAGLYAGMRPAIFATLLGGVTAYFCFVPPRYHLGFARVQDEAGFSVYVLGALGVILLTQARDRAVNKFKSSVTEMRESELRFHALADNIPQLAWMADEKGRRFWFNRRWFEYTGTTIEEVRGMGWEKVHHPDHNQRVMKLIQQSWESGDIWEDTVPLRGKDGSYCWFLSRALPIRDDKGHVVRWFGTDTDVTDRMRAEEALRRSEKLAVVGKVVATVAHELNNPLTIAVNHVFLAQNDSNIASRCEHLARAEMELRRASTLANRTLAFYSGNTPKETLSIEVLVKEVLEIFQSVCVQRNIAIKTEFIDPAYVNGSKQELWQVLLNLLSNSIDAISEDGIIRIRARTATSKHTGIPIVRLTVGDTGRGIEKEDRRKIFEPFFTTKGSSGLGLWIAKGIVEGHGGAIQVRSCTKAGNTGTVISLAISAANVKRNDEIFGRAS